MPHAIRNGLKRIATVLDDRDHPLVHDYSQRLHEKIQALGAVYRFFASGEEAYEWLRQENEKSSIVSLF